MDAVAEQLTRIFGTQGFFNLIVAGRLLLALAIGLLLGMEREIARLRSGRHKLAGLRTVTFISLLGALSVLLDRSGVLFLVLLVLLSASFGIAYVRNSIVTGQTGLTTNITVLIAFLLGAMAMRGDVETTFGGAPVVLDLTLFSVVLTIVVALLLSTKGAIEKAVTSVSPDEFFSSLKFLVVAFIILPFLPTDSVGKFVDVGHPIGQAVLDAINLYSLWFMVVLIAGIGFVGYVLGKILGAGRGVGLSGFIGGLVSSTAVMSSTAGRSKESEHLVPALLVATTVASITSFVRVLLEALALNRSLVGTIILPIGIMTLAGIVALYVLHRHTPPVKGVSNDVEQKSPFRLGPAIQFTGFILGVKVLMALTLAFGLGAGGMYLTGIISGFADVDAITLNAAESARNAVIPNYVAATTIILAVMMNMVSKAGIAIFFGSRAFAKQVAIVFGSIIAAGMVGIGITQVVFG